MTGESNNELAIRESSSLAVIPRYWKKYWSMPLLLIVGLWMLLALGCGLLPGGDDGSDGNREMETAEAASVSPTTEARSNSQGVTVPMEMRKSSATPIYSGESENTDAEESNQLSRNNDSPFGEHSVLPESTPTPTPEPTPIPEPVSRNELNSLQQTRMEEAVERCQFWYARAVRNGAQWAQFLELDPQSMSDMQRVLWREELRENDYCWPYYAEPLSAENAHKRNYAAQSYCLEEMEKKKLEVYREVKQANLDQDDRVHPQTINQYARMINYLELSGEELLAMEVRPYELFLKLWYGVNYNPADVMPLTNQLMHHNRETTENPKSPYELGETPIRESLLFHHGRIANLYGNNNENPPEKAEEIEWIGFGYVFWEKACTGYYPQLYTGYWIPAEEPTEPVRPKPELGPRPLIALQYQGVSSPWLH